MKRIKIIFMILMVPMVTISCSKGKNQQTMEGDIPATASEAVPTVSSMEETNTTDKSTDPEGKNSTVYEIKEEVYEYEKIVIKYPQITGLSDQEKQEKMNEFIREDAMRDVEDSKTEKATLEVNYEVSFQGTDLLSIKFIGYSYYPGAAHPNHTFYSTNIDVDQATRIKLKDVVDINDNFVAAFIAYSKYIGPLEADQGLEDLLEEEFHSISREGLSDADRAGVYTPYYSYFTEESLGIGIEVPFVVGGYALYEVPYTDITDYMLPEKNIWKDFPGLEPAK